MKINEKNLSAFAVSATPVDKEGYLSKKGEVNRNFQKRYFVLKGNLLFYFDKKGDKEPVGLIILEGCTIELAEDDEQFSFKIEFHGTNNRSYILAAESQESMEQWMKALACAGYDYMKLMVAELQRQLYDTEDTAVPLAQAVNTPIPPPRQRPNPFNKAENNQSRFEETRKNESSSNKNVISFWDLHNTYGRSILSDYNAWKHEQKKIKEKIDSLTGNLISF